MFKRVDVHVQVLEM